MSPGELIFIGFCSLAAINAIFFAVYIWFKRDRNIFPGILLSLFLVCIAFRIFKLFTNELQYYYDIRFNINTFFLLIPLFSLYGPILFLYIKAISIKGFQFRFIQLLHLVPFLLIFIVNIINQQNANLPSDNQRHYIIFCVEISVILIQFLIYLIISNNYFRGLKKKSITEKLPAEKAILNWIRNVIIIIRLSG